MAKEWVAYTCLSLFILAAPGVVGCGGDEFAGGQENGAAGQGGAAGQAGSAGASNQCSSPSDCAGVDTECKTKTCQDGTCGWDYMSKGTKVSEQSDGDCYINVCDGQGTVISEVDTSDSPESGSACQTYFCDTDGTAVANSAPAKTDCTADGMEGAKVCDGHGMCVECVDEADCNGDDICSGNACVPPTCANGVLDSGETDVDCGGADCEPCADGKTCGAAADCASGVCGSDGACSAPACDDGVKNGEETDIDCGGSCQDKCAPELGCKGPADCASGVCDGGKCAAPTCGDGVKNGKETDVDCGGDDCNVCETGKACNDGADCSTGACQSNVCVAASCQDSVKNGQETDVDCGGADCQPCVDGKTCGTGADCVSGVCENGTCSVPNCQDGVKNAKETDIDCGGTCPTKCAFDKSCRTGSDCASGLCYQTQCKECVPDTNECQGSALRSCTSSGKWTATTTCQGVTPVCNDKFNHCLVCDPSEAFCSADELKRCKTDGTDWQKTTCDGNTPVCDPFRKQCTECQPGEAKCTGDSNAGVLWVCQHDSTWQKTSCGDASQCDSVAKRCLDNTIPQVTDFDVSGSFGCAITGGTSSQAGDLRCWGSNMSRAVVPTATSDTVYTRFAAAAYWSGVKVIQADNPAAKVDKAYSVATGAAHACAVVPPSRGVRCWGYNGDEEKRGCAGTYFNRVYGGISAYISNSGGEVLKNVQSLALGRNLSCALTASGQVHCWGDCSHGTSDTCQGLYENLITFPAADKTIHQITVDRSNDVACALSTNNNVYCWNDGVKVPASVLVTGIGLTGTVDAILVRKGANGNELWVKSTKSSDKIHIIKFSGNVAKTGWNVSSTTTVPASANLKQFSATPSGALVGVYNDGRVVPDASNYFGTTGLKALNHGNARCVLTTKGTVRCAGVNDGGALGNGKPLDLPKPTLMRNLSGVERGWVGRFSSTFVQRDGTQVGVGHSSVLFPSDLQNLLPKVVQNSANDLAFFSLGRDKDAASDDNHGYKNVGSGATQAVWAGNSSTTGRLLGHGCSHFKSAYVSKDYDIGLCDDGDVYVYLQPDNGGQLAYVHGMTLDKFDYGHAGKVLGNYNVVQIAKPGYYAGHTCVLTNVGNVLCWGWNHHGQVGNKVTQPQWNGVHSPFKVDLGTDLAKQVVVQGYTSCALTTAGDVYCWGDGVFGQTGNGKFVDFVAPQKIPNLSGAEQLAANTFAACARMNNGTVQCWGSNLYREQGDPALGTMSQSSPHRVPNLDHVVDLQGAEYGFCATKDDGTVWCWGNGRHGMAGIGRADSESFPQLVVGLN